MPVQSKITALQALAEAPVEDLLCGFHLLPKLCREIGFEDDRDVLQHVDTQSLGREITALILKEIVRAGQQSLSRNEIAPAMAEAINGL